ncbi:cytochrome-c peroxidase [Thalassotalea agarivorans]|uniref:Cytochrome c peroxidase n=1 Tax=Thalassotalea agarivorans TaxID=349064 RepID=A0A1H9Y4X0_THASX|nr:cytochrome c peroxidase [Thalassotalea agarivorans]SES63914.1 cytochrome c peroxidase [Thalassotalea agarivorans]
MKLRLQNFFIVFLSLSLLACGGESSNTIEPDNNASAEPNDPIEQDDPFAQLNLPDTPFNYANIELPEHLTSNAFGAQFMFQRPASDLDNTPAHNPITDAGATLGRVLFFDKKLSANGSVACASCHLPAHGFSDPKVLSEGFDGGLTRRHSMGLVNARFYFTGKFFWDERAAALEDQVLMPFQDPVEMGLVLAELEEIVSNQAYYPPLFEQAFGDSDVSSERISFALAQFVRSLVSTTSRYDVARAQVSSPTADFPAFTAQENLGKDLFFLPRVLENGERANCAGCHVSEAFVGPVPNDGVGSTIATNNGLDAISNDDLGVAETTGLQRDTGKFKVPSLRNIAIRPPYMHDGRFATLDEVIDHYSTNIQNHPQLAGPLRTDSGEPVQFAFSEEEKAALVAFLNTLTDDEMLTDEKYNDPFIE